MRRISKPMQTVTVTGLVLIAKRYLSSVQMLPSEKAEMAIGLLSVVNFSPVNKESHRPLQRERG
ncbi:Pseudouridylate synthase [Pseudomonas syringae pv. actinidiae]|uniref:Pseudouridylate synthase n=1 Tax=Pseudomonas syringae pv. actinidiae TaxID=103796 RepID=A0A2V0Q6G1_PSESF|nr:Pseudouridylate synthase [Pseudomonas syringae pv. actinidiae]